MAVVVLVVGSISETPIEGGYAAPDSVDGAEAANPNGDLLLHVKNTGISSATLTVTAQKTSFSVSGHGPLAKDDLVVSLDAGEEKFVGPFPKRPWNDSDDKVEMEAGGAGAADIEVAALRVA